MMQVLGLLHYAHCHTGWFRRRSFISFYTRFIITNSAKKEIEHMTQKDVVTVCGGANNISKNESNKGLKRITQFMQNHHHHWLDSP